MSNTVSSGSRFRSAAICEIVRPGSAAPGELAMRISSQLSIWPKLLKPTSAIFCRTRERICGSASRASMASMPPSCSQTGSRKRSGLVAQS